MPTDIDDRKALVEWLATHDDACPMCSYALRGTPEAKCPECGAQLHLAVASPSTFTGAWALAVVSFSLALGFDGVVLLLGCTVTAVNLANNAITWNGDAARFLLFVSPLVVLCVASAIGLWQCILRRRSWLLLPRRRQWRLAVLIFLLVGAAHAAGGLIMFAIGQGF